MLPLLMTGNVTSFYRIDTQPPYKVIKKNKKKKQITVSTGLGIREGRREEKRKINPRHDFSVTYSLPFHTFGK